MAGALVIAGELSNGGELSAGGFARLVAATPEAVREAALAGPRIYCLPETDASACIRRHKASALPLVSYCQPRYRYIFEPSYLDPKGNR
jgi:hypothetical protein